MVKKISILVLLVFLLVLTSLGCINKDSDNDGYPDEIDAFPDDYNFHLDTDNDGCADETDVFPEDARYQSHSDRIGDINDIDLLNKIGIELVDNRNYKQSIEYFNKSLSISFDEYILRKKAYALYEIGNYDESINCIDEILIHNESSYKSLCLKTSCLYKIGKLDEAIKCVEMAIAINPDYEVATVMKSLLIEEYNYKHENDIGKKIKYDLKKMGYPNARVRLIYELKQIEINIGKFHSTTDSYPDLRPQFQHIARKIGSLDYIRESSFKKVNVGWMTSWSIEGDGTLGTSAHGRHPQHIYYDIVEGKITYY